MAAAQAGPSDEHDREKAGESETPLLEWLIAGVGLVLVIGVLGSLLYTAIWRETSPPHITVRIISVAPVQNGFLAQFRAVNQGGSTAEGIVIEGELRSGAETVESSHTTLDYLPANSERGGGLFFTQDPRRFDFQIRAFGYQQP